ncbi:hypothetical protein BH11ACT7_BH11ACT7_27780 [soil metagenome]
MPKLGESETRRVVVAEQRRDAGLINVEFLGAVAQTYWHEQLLGEVTADAVLIPDLLNSQQDQRYTSDEREARRTMARGLAPTHREIVPESASAADGLAPAV